MKIIFPFYLIIIYIIHLTLFEIKFSLFITLEIQKG